MSGIGPYTRDAHVAFPGGKTEEGDEGGLYTGEYLPFVYPRDGGDCIVRGRRMTHKLRRVRGYYCPPASLNGRTLNAKPSF